MGPEWGTAPDSRRVGASRGVRVREIRRGKSPTGQGAPGVPKSEEHRRRISAGLHIYWASEAGRAERIRRRASARLARLERRRAQALHRGKA